MKNIKSFKKVLFNLIGFLVLTGISCKREIDGLQGPTFPTTADVFIDDFTSDLAYAAFGGSDVKAFQVDKQVAYGTTKASMRFDVPDANSPNGSYAGGVFFSKTGRDLSGYNAISFYIKATQAATIGVVGFGNDLGENKYQVTKNGLLVNSNWKKVILAIPDPSKLTGEKGLFYYATGPENGRGYTFWIDEVKFEKVSDLGNLSGIIFNGEDRIVSNAENGNTFAIDGVKTSVNLTTGIFDTLNVSPSYFNYSSSDPTVATVSEKGIITVLSGGTTTITAKLGGLDAIGSIILTSLGPAIVPPVAAPAPTVDPADVISMYSNTYTNVPVDTWNTHWLYSTAENTFIKINDNDVISYKMLNFVGIEFKNPTIDASAMKFFHMDIWTPDATTLPNNFKILLVDFGANGIYGGGDDVSHEVTITSPTLVSNNWVSIDIPLTAFTGLTTKAHLGQMVLSGSLPNVFVDNVYFYKSPATPPGAAPTPTISSGNVLSVFSDSYMNISGTDFNPNWGQATVVTQTLLGGNNALYYANFNYQGLQFGSTQDVSSYGYLHLDYYSSDATDLNVYLISTGGIEKPYKLSVPTIGWNSVDIPLSAFSPVALNSVIQMKFDGGTGNEIYLDNIYFWKILPVPNTAAPTPTYTAGNVISIFSDAYTNVSGSNLNPNWGQSTIVSQTPIVGNNTLLYTGLNYQGLEFGSSQDVSSMSYLHLDYYSPNSTSLKVYLISPGPVETPSLLTVPTSSGWNSVDIPLTAFSPVALTNVFQMKFEGNGNIYLDNILFRK